MERETKEFSISSSRRPASQVMYWQGGELKIQTPPVPQVLQDNYKPCFHAWLTQKVTTSQFSPGECRITLVMTEKEWGLSLKKKQTWKAVVVFFFSFFLTDFLPALLEKCWLTHCKCCPCSRQSCTVIIQCNECCTTWPAMPGVIF